MSGRECGGCNGRGSHVRWCPKVVGAAAARRARQANQADALGDAVAMPEAASLLWKAAGVLRAEAVRLTEDRRARSATEVGS